MSNAILLRSIADALQEGHSISQHVSAKALHDAADEIERLRAALKSVGDDYPGSSCQQWCYEQAGISLSESPTVPHWFCAECRGQAMTSDGPIIHVATCSRR